MTRAPATSSQSLGPAVAAGVGSYAAMAGVMAGLAVLAAFLARWS